MRRRRRRGRGSGRGREEERMGGCMSIFGFWFLVFPAGFCEIEFFLSFLQLGL